MKKYLPSFPGCFACGKENPIGIQLLIFEENEKIQAEFKSKSYFSGFPGIVHGGISCTLLDEIMWWAAFAASGKIVVTGEITVKLLKPLLQDGSYTLSAEIVEKKKRYIVVSGNIRDVEDIYCRSTGKYFFLPGDKDKQFKNHFKYQDLQGKPIPPELRFII